MNPAEPIRQAIPITRIGGILQIPEGYREIRVILHPELSYYAMDCHTCFWQPYMKGVRNGPALPDVVAIEQIIDLLPAAVYTIGDLFADISQLDCELHELRDTLRNVGPFAQEAIQTRISQVLEVRHNIFSITLDKPEQFRKV